MHTKLGIVAALICSLGQAQTQPVPPPPKTVWHTVARGQAYVPMTAGQRTDFLVRKAVFSAGAPASAAFQASFDQWTNEPEDWKQGWGAYGRRLGSRWATNGVRNVVESGAAAALGYEQRYIQCDCDGTLHRAAHAMAMNFVTYNRRGRWVPNIPRVGSTIAAEYIARGWLPDEHRTVTQDIQELSLQLVTGSLVNVWREFSPPLIRRIKSKLPRR